MEIALYILIWAVVSLAYWIYYLESSNNNNGPNSNLRIFLLLTLTLPAVILLVSIIIIVEASDQIKERRLLKKKIEQSKYGVFERKVIVEKYCKHIWREDRASSSWRDRKFRCTKCKTRTKLTVDEFRFLRGLGMVDGEYEREPYIGHIDFLR